MTASVLTLQFLALIAHGWGDYVLQSHWMATTKTSQSRAALAHVAVYGVVFAVLVTRSPVALAVIVGTHFFIDRYRLARYVIWAKNFIAPAGPDGHRNLPWAQCQATGFDPEVPAFLAVWLLIIVDNILHLSVNATALYFWG